MILDGGKMLEFAQHGARVEVHIPDAAPDSVASVLVFKTK
jgi:hypothetical protein